MSVNILFITAIVTIVIFICSTANAQPGCRNKPYSPANYCEFTHSSDRAYFVGRIEAISREQHASSSGKLVLKVAKIKDPSASSENNLSLVTEDEPGCVNDLIVGATYIFAVPEIAAEGNAALRFSRLSLNGLTDTEKSKSINSVVPILDGKRQPILFGKVSRPDGIGFANVKVSAKADSENYSAVTNAGGEFNFVDLPEGRYTVAVTYPNGFMPDDYYKVPRETDEREFQTQSSGIFVRFV